MHISESSVLLSTVSVGDAVVSILGERTTVHAGGMEYSSKLGVGSPSQTGLLFGAGVSFEPSSTAFTPVVDHGAVFRGIWGSNANASATFGFRGNVVAILYGCRCVFVIGFNGYARFQNGPPAINYAYNHLAGLIVGGGSIVRIEAICVINSTNNADCITVSADGRLYMSGANVSGVAAGTGYGINVAGPGRAYVTARAPQLLGTIVGNDLKTLTGAAQPASALTASGSAVVDPANTGFIARAD